MVGLRLIMSAALTVKGAFTFILLLNLESFSDQ